MQTFFEHVPNKSSRDAVFPSESEIAPTTPWSRPLVEYVSSYVTGLAVFKSENFIIKPFRPVLNFTVKDGLYIFAVVVVKGVLVQTLCLAARTDCGDERKRKVRNIIGVRSWMLEAGF